MARDLDPFQLAAIRRVYANIVNGIRRQILVAPTGAGKTIMGGRVAYDCAVGRGRKVVWATHRVDLVNQSSERLREWGVPNAVMVDGRAHDPSAPVQVCSVQTLMGSDDVAPPILSERDLLVIDEAHRADFDELFKLYGNALILALTATPCNDSGMPMSEKYQTLVEAATISQLVSMPEDQRRIVPVRAFSFDVSTEEDIAKVIRESVVMSKALEQVTAMPRVQTAFFCCDIPHTEAVHARLKDLGWNPVFVHSRYSESSRALTEFNHGRADAIVSADKLVEGWDCPRLSRIVMLRPTESIVVYLQTIGRGVRSFPGKTRCELLDFAGNILRHGMPQDDRVWTIDADVARRSKRQRAGSGVWRCLHCFVVCSPPADGRCPECGLITPPGRRIRTMKGQLVEWDEDKAKSTAELRKRALVEKKTDHEYRKRLIMKCRFQLGMEMAAATGHTKWLLNEFKENWRGTFDEFIEHRFKKKTGTWKEARTADGERAPQPPDRSGDQASFEWDSDSDG